ncbi:MAG: NADH-quinone oxidoreductase subunit M [Alphaproteobacteria bacterium]|nr:NADH-quinone oxidoreductase subunit M [Alphaproteobacteria bacterium]
MMHGYLLSLITFLPLVGAFGLFLLPCGSKSESFAWRVRGVALAVSLLTLVLSLGLYTNFDPSVVGFQFIEKHEWIPSFGIAYHKGVDGISLWFVLLSTLLSPIAMISGFAVKERVRPFMVALLLLETMMIGMFTALDLFLFYVFFEGVLIPMFLIIGIWGGENRIYAAMKFFLYTFLGSVLMLVAIFAMILTAGTSDMTVLTSFPFSKELALWLWLAFFASFAVKTPMWPFHTWLPYAHVEAPTAGSVILAGVLLKMGGYGFIRISLQMLPEASAVFAPLVIALSLVAIVYTSLVALAQTDMKKLIAYSSVAHMGYVTLGIFSGTPEGLEGAMMVMLSHGLVASALFLCVGVVYERLHTREIARFGGVATVMPRYASVAMVFTLAAVGLPGTSGFIGEFLTMQGAWLMDGKIAALAALGIVLGAAYMLWLYRRVFFGVAEKADVKAMPDLTWRELAMFTPLLVLVLWMGLYPTTFRVVFAPTVASIVPVQAHDERPGQEMEDNR